MIFEPYVINSISGSKVPVKILSATEEDLNRTTADPKWQTDWTSDYLSRPSVDKYAIKNYDGDLIGLGAYQIRGKSAYVYIIYAESAPHSNPTMKLRPEREYYGIGQLLVAFGIKYSIDHGCRGDVVFDAKTDELAKHYEFDFKAKRVANGDSGIKRFMLADEDAWNLFSLYLEEEDHGE